MSKLLSVFLILTIFVPLFSFASDDYVEAIVQVVTSADETKVSNVRQQHALVVHRFDLIMITGGRQQLRERLAEIQVIDHSQRLPFVSKLFLVSQAVEVSSYDDEKKHFRTGAILKARLRPFEKKNEGRAVVGYPRKKLDKTWELLSYEFLRQEDIDITRHGRVRGGTLAVVTGTEPGWLFRGRERYLWQYENRNLFPEPELQKLASHIKNLKSHLDDQGIRLYLVMVPSKFHIYPEFFPTSVLNYASTKTRAEQTDKLLSNTIPGHWIDLRTTIEQAKRDSSELLYYPKDHHWNFRGAYFGYRELINVMSRDLPGLKSMQWEDFELEQNVKSSESLIGMSNLEWYTEESDVGVAHRPETAPSQTDYNLLFIADSYGWFLHPMLSYNFKNTRFVFEELDKPLSPEFLKEHSPDAVVILFFETLVERYMLTTYQQK